MKKILICMTVLCSLLTGCSVLSETETIPEQSAVLEEVGFLSELSDEIPEDAVLKITGREYIRDEYSGDRMLEISIEYQNSHGDVVLSGMCDAETEIFAPDERHIFQYDENGNIIQESVISQYNAKNIFYEYDDVQNLVCETTYFSSGGKQVITRTYDQYHNVIRNHLVNYKPLDTVILESTARKAGCQYDENGNLLKYSMVIGKNDDISYTVTNTYNPLNQLVSYEYLNMQYGNEEYSSDYASVHCYQYDENGNQILDELTVYSEPDVISSIDSDTEIRQYDKQNRLIYREMHRGYGTVVCTDYEYENL